MCYFIRSLLHVSEELYKGDQTSEMFEITELVSGRARDLKSDISVLFFFFPTLKLTFRDILKAPPASQLRANCVLNIKIFSSSERI